MKMEQGEITAKFLELLTIEIPDGKPDFEAMMSRFQSKRRMLDNSTLSYVVFDVIQYKGKSVAKLPLIVGGASADVAIVNFLKSKGFDCESPLTGRQQGIDVKASKGNIEIYVESKASQIV